MEKKGLYSNFTCHRLSDGALFYSSSLPDALTFRQCEFDSLWALHPEFFLEINMHGRKIRTPRWQQAYGRDYEYSGIRNKGLPIPGLLIPLVDWARMIIDDRLNGILLNWYDGSLGHYIGKHRDSTINLVNGSPIVTVSFGEERIWRLRPWKGHGMLDFTAQNGTIYIMPYNTNLTWTHEVPKFKRYTGKRISVTIRAFTD